MHECVYYICKNDDMYPKVRYIMRNNKPEYNVVEQYLLECIQAYKDEERYKFLDEEDYAECGNNSGFDW